MSVDQRIREGLGTIQTELMPVDTDAALARTMRRAGRSRARRRAAGGLAAAAAVAAAATLAAVRFDVVPDSAPPPTSQPPDGDAVPAKPTELDGTWRSEPLSFRDMADNLREQGLGEWVPEFRQQTGRFQDLRARLVVEDEVVYYRLRGHAEDNWQIRIDGDRVFFLGSEGAWINTYDLERSDDGATLSLRLRTGADATWQGIPIAVYQTAFYTTSAFHRVE
jgi:hypothetical protein